MIIYTLLILNVHVKTLGHNNGFSNALIKTKVHKFILENVSVPRIYIHTIKTDVTKKI